MMNKSSLLLALPAVMLGLSAATIACAGVPPKRVIIVPPLQFDAPSSQHMPENLSRPLTKPYWQSSRYKITWTRVNHEKARDALLQTQLPTAREPLRHDLTPLFICPVGEYRKWQSFGTMPAAEFFLAGLSGYNPGSLCSPSPHH
jgi:hypothetical protein